MKKRVHPLRVAHVFRLRRWLFGAGDHMDDEYIKRERQYERDDH